MTLFHTLFYLLAAVITMATALTIRSRNLVHAVVYLVVSFMGTALLFYLLGAPMLAALEVIIYAGAIMVLFLIIIMLIQVDVHDGEAVRLKQPLLAVGICGVFFGLTGTWIYHNPGSLTTLQAAMVSPREFGATIFERYWLAVEAVSFLLFVALVGAFYLSKGPAVVNDSTGSPMEDEK
jgi:NADH-quinone oxidoreductase subunit J